MPTPLALIATLSLTTLLYALHDATMKYLSLTYAVPLLVWARYLIQMVLMLIVLGPTMGRSLVVTGRPALMSFRALMQVGSALGVQLALRTMPLAETTALLFLTPMIVALLAGPTLGEQPGRRGWLAILGGFGGVLLIARPGSNVDTAGLVFALGAAFCSACYQLSTRYLSASEPPLRQLFYLTLLGTFSMSFAVPAEWTGEIPDAISLVLLVGAALSVATGHFLFIRATRDTPVSTLSALLYTKLIWAVLLGLAIFGQAPDAFSVAGMLVIGAAGLSLMRPAPAAATA
ncbi:DMT family transporter [Propionivibrio dicarboxylicus]|uniref:Threonine/homoserine efflux transporter RhtA n=1 Tax=Propionivibrio dicarboxylicus TaxID=83767 RepID=A0A1G7YI15_9RHOO|nr:DMT family transporter [Propionivibrio dicarboxylicus]SDG96014.1 Threonine/homoserine efflux transporter RhtA [Propionivibrio dicarboxylicus]